MKSLLSLFLLTSTLSKCNAYLSNTIIKSKLGFKSMPSSNYMTNTILFAAPKSTEKRKYSRFIKVFSLKKILPVFVGVLSDIAIRDNKSHNL